jgi:hypothetical protein
VLLKLLPTTFSGFFERADVVLEVPSMMFPAADPLRTLFSGLAGIDAFLPGTIGGSSLALFLVTTGGAGFLLA